MKRYPEYKDSGIEWIGNIPKHWDLNKIKYSTYIKGRVGWHGLNTNDFIEEGPYLVTGTDFFNGQVKWDFCYHISEDKYNQDPYIMLKENDLLITKDGTIGKVAIVNNIKGKATLNSGIFVTRPLHNIYITKYMYWILNSVVIYEFIVYNKIGSTVLHLYQDTFEKFLFPVPLIEEQEAIAKFLDNKTESINDLISKKQRLIELLKEERAAIIDQAVTKGLDPNAPMKDSGIKWLGKIPVHWEVKRLKFLANLKYGLGQPPKSINNGIPLIRATNIERGCINNKALIYVDPDDIPYERDPILKTNDIIVVRSGAYTADSAIITEEYNGSIAGYDMIARAKTINPVFLSYALLSNYLLVGQLYLHRLRAAQPHLNVEELGSAMIAFPKDGNEQSFLTDYILKETSKIDKTISNIEKEIELLKEYRTALISEVVTGKIDVRDEVIK